MENLRNDEAYDIGSSVLPTARVASRVLVLDDAGAVRGLVSARLKPGGYEVRDVAGGARLKLEAWALEDLEVDVVIVDSTATDRLPLEALRTLRAAGWLTPTIVMTDSQEPALRREAAAIDVLVLAKRAPIDLLAHAVLRHLGGVVGAVEAAWSI